jgi:hypothetical protein
MSGQTNSTTEDLAKADIIDFLRVYRNAVLGTNTTDDYLILIKGGVIKGQSTIGFLALKAKLYGLMNLNSDNNSVALNYIQNYNNNLS